MKSFIVKRLISTIPILLIISLITFSLMHFTPGDPARMMAGDIAPDERVQEIRDRLGLDLPFHQQYLRWLGRAIKGDLGDSIFLKQPVLISIIERLEPSLLIAFFAVLMSITFGIPVGMIAAVKQNTWVDQVVMMIAMLGFSIPSFWIGMNLILAFSIQIPLFPSYGYVSVTEGLIEWARYTTLPIFALGFVQTAIVARMTRSSMLDVLKEDYVRTARAKGLFENVVLFKHALKNAMIPIVTVVGISFGIAISGIVILETIFGIPGIGQLIFQAITRRDFPIVQGVLLLTGLIFVIINLIIDMIYVLLDPNITY